MTGAYLYNADLTDADLRYADLTNADFSSATVTNANFYSAVTVWIDGEVYDEQPDVIISCELVPYAYCAGADLSGMDLSGMDLTGIDLRGANLQNTTFDYATLDGADLRSIIAMNANFIHTGIDTYLQYAEFNRYSASDCGGWCGEANLTNASLDKANLADLTMPT